MARRAQTLILHVPRLRAVDILLLIAAGALLSGLLAVAPTALGRVRPSVVIDLRPSALPAYTGLSLLRMAGAYLLSLLFTLVFGYAAARNRAAERILVPILDILQSIPVLSFLPAVLLAMVALFPRHTLGLELGSVVLIFTGMVWNMTFSFYHSLLTIPDDLMEAARSMRLTWWQRLTSIELPVAAIGLVWNSVMSWAGGWFFLMACESFTLVNQSFTLPGLGSYLAVASSRGDIPAVLWGVGVLVTLTVAFDQLLWRPLIAWSARFKVELAADPDPPRSWILAALRRSRLLPWVGSRAWRPLIEAVDRAVGGADTGTPATPRALFPMRLLAACRWLLAAVVVVGVAEGALGLGRMLAGMSAPEWGRVGVAAAATFVRVGIAVAVALLWTVPAGVAIGLHPRLARVMQPLAQLVASVPATALFPILLLVLVRTGGGLNVASVLLMLLGTQWYLLFNVIGGASAIPRDLLESSEIFRVRGWLRWRTLLLPAIFPYLVTGGITAQGGAWNASIISEYVVFGDRTLQTVGLGALIAGATQSANYPLLAASTMTMAVIVVLMNRLGWRRAARAAETRYHM